MAYKDKAQDRFILKDYDSQSGTTAGKSPNYNMVCSELEQELLV